MGSFRGKWLQPDVPFRPSRSPVFYGWVIVGASVMGMASSMPGQTIGFSAFTEPLMNNLDLSRVQLSTAYLIGTASSGLILPRIGKFFDKYGARLTGILVEIAFGLSLFYMAACSGIYQALKPTADPLPWLALCLVMLGFFLMRFLGQGVIAMVSRAMLGKWFNRKRGLASALAGSVGSVVFSLAPVVLFALRDGLGWRQAWVALGIFMMFVVSALCWLIFRDNPEECGLEMDGEPAPTAATGPTDPEFTIYKEFTGPEAIRTYSFWVFTAVFSMMGIVATAISFHAEDVARGVGVTTEVFIGLFLWMAVFSIPLGFLIGWLTGKTRLKYLLVVMATMMALHTFALINLAQPFGIAFYVVTGAMNMACFGNMMAVSYPRFFGRKHLGAVSGWSMFTMVISSSFAPLLWSLTKQLGGSYNPAFWAFIACCTVLVIAAFFADNPQRKLAPA